jgi:hypothetical protein
MNGDPLAELRRERCEREWEILGTGDLSGIFVGRGPPL